MSKDRCCGNCKSFTPANGGYGACSQPSMISGVYYNNSACSMFKTKQSNGWTEITPDNVDEIYNINEELLMIGFKLGDKIYYQHKSLMRATLNTLAKSEGYYYYVLPELKIDGTEQI